MTYHYIIFEKGELCRIRMNRPQKLNALNPDVFNELEAAIEDCAQDPGIKVVLITGDKKAFGAGADIEQFSKADITTAFRLTDQSQRVFRRLAGIPKPTIAAIAGFALGGGLELALCCDFRIAAENAVFGFPEINLGLIPGGGGTQRLMRLIGESSATEIVFLGENLKAGQAEKFGLVNKVVPLDQLELECEKLAQKLIAKSPVALRAAKTSMRVGMNVGIEEGLKIEQNNFCMLFGTADVKEGISSFVEKRKPIFTGK